MSTENTTTITVEATINAPIEKVWTCWTRPDDIMQWNNASENWHTPSATNDLRQGGEFHYLMAAKDGSFEFDFWGTYDDVVPHQRIGSTLGDGRKVEVSFSDNGDTTHIVEAFEAESTNPIDLQRFGWQSILNNFKKYVENNAE